MSKKIALLFGAALAVCAFAAPMASAASWFLVGTTHQLTTNDFAFSQAIGGGLTTGLSCATTQFDSDVTSAAVLTIACNALVHSQNVTWTGTLTGGSFDPSAIGANRRITFVNASGVVSHSALANGAPTLFTFSLRDPAGTLNILD
ncbi:MAG TPA: hypothetical protein VFY45_07455 [Baekduia sp.]|nr:hypothetical protein [Baekduia sp.]